MIRQPVIVLDQVHPAAREERAQLRQPRGAQPDRLERGAGDRAVVDVQEMSRNPAAPNFAPGSARDRPGHSAGSSRSAECDMRLQRRIAEEDVEELRRVVRRGDDGKIDRDAMNLRRDFFHARQPSDDLLQYERIAQRLARQLHRLFQQERLDARVELGRVGGGDMIDRAQRGPGGGRKHPRTVKARAAMTSQA